MIRRRNRSTSLADLVLLAAAALALHAAPAAAQFAQPGDLPPLDADVRAAVVDSITAVIDSVYVLAEPAQRIVTTLRGNLASGAYDDITDPAAFAERLESDCQAVNHDGHFGIRALPPLDPTVAAARQDEDPAETERRRRRDAASNYGFRQVEILAGGVGYLRFDRFADGEEAFAAATAAMNFLANCDAVILDLRQNGGGAASMIRYLAGYLFPESTHLINWDIRARGITRQSHSADFVPGRRLTEQPVYVLTSGRTFSAAEEFTFDLRNHERAVVVGETTGGGGHTVAGYAFGFEGFRMMIRVPYGRAYNPLNNEGWEGVGVRPHIAVPAAQALDAAHADALRKLLEKAADPRDAAPYRWALAEVEARLTPYELPAGKLDEYAGTFGPRRIYVEDGALYYQREGRPAYLLSPLSEDVFMVEGLDFFRLEAARDGAGRVVRLVGHYDDGRTDGNDRTGG
jgi:hypothetical protein